MLGAQSEPEARIYRAKATIRGAAGSGISGVVRFTQVDGDAVNKVFGVHTTKVLAPHLGRI